MNAETIDADAMITFRPQRDVGAWYADGSPPGPAGAYRVALPIGVEMLIDRVDADRLVSFDVFPTGDPNEASQLADALASLLGDVGVASELATVPPEPIDDLLDDLSDDETADETAGDRSLSLAEGSATAPGLAESRPVVEDLAVPTTTLARWLPLLARRARLEEDIQLLGDHAPRLLRGLLYLELATVEFGLQPEVGLTGGALDAAEIAVAALDDPEVRVAVARAGFTWEAVQQLSAVLVASATEPDERRDAATSLRDAFAAVFEGKLIDLADTTGPEPITAPVSVPLGDLLIRTFRTTLLEIVPDVALDGDAPPAVEGIEKSEGTVAIVRSVEGGGFAVEVRVAIGADVRAGTWVGAFSSSTPSAATLLALAPLHDVHVADQYLIATLHTTTLPVLVSVHPSPSGVPSSQPRDVFALTDEAIVAGRVALEHEESLEWTQAAQRWHAAADRWLAVDDGERAGLAYWLEDLALTRAGQKSSRRSRLAHALAQGWGGTRLRVPSPIPEPTWHEARRLLRSTADRQRDR